MKAFAAFAPGDIRAIDLPIPEIDDYEALVENEGCVFCNATDRMVAEDLFATPGYPVVFGHESFGRVIKIGARVRKYRLGDRVICSNAIVRGYDGRFYSTWGGFAEYGVAGDLDAYLADGHPLDEANAYRGRYAANCVIPGDLPAEKAALVFPLAETASAATQVGTLEGKRVVVVGTGIAGYSLTYFARVYGAASVVTLGRRASRLEIASHLGADRVFLDPAEAAAYFAPSGGADIVFEASGNDAALLGGLTCLREDGLLAVYAVPRRPYSLDFSKTPRAFRCLRVAPRVEEAIDLVARQLRENPLLTELLLTRTWDFDQTPRAFEQVCAGEVVKGMTRIHSQPARID